MEVDFPDPEAQVDVVAASPSLEQQLLGKMLAGKYELAEVQASGAFGTVFRANQFFCKQLMRPVAVKVSRQSGLTEDNAPYLFGDALVLARLLASSDHEGRRHLVQIYDMGLLPEYDNRAYLVMEYVDGLPLLSHMRAGRTHQRGHGAAIRQAGVPGPGAGARSGGGAPGPQIGQHPH